MKAAVELMQQLKVDILECMVVIELVDLAGRKAVSSEVFALIPLVDK